jgi:hypothetical protein
VSAIFTVSNITYSQKKEKLKFPLPGKKIKKNCTIKKINLEPQKCGQFLEKATA